MSKFSVNGLGFTNTLFIWKTGFPSASTPSIVESTIAWYSVPSGNVLLTVDLNVSPTVTLSGTPSTLILSPTSYALEADIRVPINSF